MEATLGIDLLNQSFEVKQMTVGDALAIASVHTKYNERRLSVMIDEMSDRHGLSATLTAQERYQILLSHHALSDNTFVDSGLSKTPSDYFISDTKPSEVPKYYEIDGIKVGHLYGRHLDILDMLHENGAEWYNGQLACQVIGDISHIIGGDSDEWDELTVEMPEAEIRAEIIRRIKFINKLSTDKFEALANFYNDSVLQLAHFVVLGVDNEGITLIAQRGARKGDPERFCPLERLRGTIEQLTQLISPTSNDDDDTRENEFARSDEA